MRTPSGLTTRRDVAVLRHGNARLGALCQAVAAVSASRSDCEVYDILSGALGELGYCIIVVSFESETPPAAAEAEGPQGIIQSITMPRPRLLPALERLTGQPIVGYRLPVQYLPLGHRTFELKEAGLATLGTEQFARLLPDAYGRFVPSIARRVGMQYCITAPMFPGDRMPTVLLLIGDDLRSEDVPLISTLTGHVRVAVENAQLIQSERRRREEAEMLRDLVITVNSTLDLDEVLSLAVRRLQKLHRATACSASFLVEDGKTLVLKATTDPALDLSSEQIMFPAEHSIAGRALREQRVQITDDLRLTPEYYSPLAQRTVAGSTTRSMLTAPLVVEEVPVGVIQVLSATPGAFDEADAQLLSTTAALVSTAVGRARTYEQIKEYADELGTRVEARTAEVTREHERLQAVLENAGGGIAITGPDGVIEYANPAWERLTGHKAEHAIRHKMRIVSPEIFPELFTDQSSLAFRPRVYRRELSDQRPDGTRYTVDLTVSPVFTDSGGAKELVSLVAIYRDVTEIKELDRVKSQFLSTAAHQLRTPLTTILGFSELLLTRSHLSEAEQKRFITHINQRAQQLKALVEDLFDISRFETGAGAALNLEALNLRPLLAEEIARWQMRNPAHRYVLRGPDEWPEVYADKDRIVRQVIRHILSNATKYSPGGGTITVTVTPIGKYTEVSVADEGIGMTTDQLQNLFSKFWRADDSTTALDGTGLGLVIVKYVIEQHGGQVWVESTPERGTVVHFTLLQAEHPTTVLIVDDESAVLEMEQHVLEADGLSVLLARSGGEALKIAGAYRPDLILLDLMMPDMSGLDMLVALKEDPVTTLIPVLVVSAQSGWQIIEEAHKLGAIDFLTKPFEYEELLSRVRRALKASALPVTDRKLDRGIVPLHSPA